MEIYVCNTCYNNLVFSTKLQESRLLQMKFSGNFWYDGLEGVKLVETLFCVFNVS